jgi:hypothetical protein
MELRKLEKLLIGEVSGVDDPANEIPGWMVAKGRDGVSGRDARRADGLSAIKGRRVGNDLFIAVEGCPSVSRYKPDGSSEEIDVSGRAEPEPESVYTESSLPPAIQRATLTLPWRDATTGRYRRIF